MQVGGTCFPQIPPLAAGRPLFSPFSELLVCLLSLSLILDQEHAMQSRPTLFPPFYPVLFVFAFCFRISPSSRPRVVLPFYGCFRMHSTVIHHPPQPTQQRKGSKIGVASITDHELTPCRPK